MTLNQLRAAAGVALFATQAAVAVVARSPTNRYFCWAPYDMQTDYRIESVTGGRQLSADEIFARYRLRAEGSEKRFFGHVARQIAEVERRYHSDDPAIVRMVYRNNGRAWQVWRWPQP